MDGDQLLGLWLIVLTLTVGGCLYGEDINRELTQREKEKTKQMEIQYRLDSIRIIHSIKKDR